MTPRESDDARFRELMEREFPAGLVGARGSQWPHPSQTPRADVEQSTPDAPDDGGTSPSSRTGGEAPATATPAGPTVPTGPGDPESGFRRWAPADEPEEPFVTPPAPPAGRWTWAGIIGTVGVALPLLLVLLAAFGVRLPMLVSVLAGAGFFAGVGLLLHRLRRRPPTDGDGAVV